MRIGFKSDNTSMDLDKTAVVSLAEANAPLSGPEFLEAFDDALDPEAADEFIEQVEGSGA